MSWACAACTLTNSDADPSCVGCGATARSGALTGVSAAAAARAAAAPATLDAVPEVLIDGDGVFKYVQIRVTRAEGADALLVRGHAFAAYHDDVFQTYRRALARLPGVTAVACPGGGRLAIDAAQRTARVYGHSIGYGRADHAATAAALGRALPGYAISHDDEGY